MSIIVIASRNNKKVIELQPMLAEFRYDPISLSDWEQKQKVVIPTTEENRDTFYGNALLKAESIFEECEFPILADDSGLVIPALNGEPGVKSARYADDMLEQSNTNNTTHDQRNVAKVISKIKALDSSTNLDDNDKERSTAAYFTTVIVALLKTPDEEGMLQKKIIHGEGICHGMITCKPRGSNGFGYDPIFIPNEHNLKRKTFAEMSDDEKNAISHRSLAIQNFIANLKDYKN